MKVHPNQDLSFKMGHLDPPQKTYHLGHEWTEVQPSVSYLELLKKIQWPFENSPEISPNYVLHMSTMSSLLTLHRSSALSVAQHSFKGRWIATIQQPRHLYKSGLTLRWTRLDRSQSCSKDVQKNVHTGHGDLIYSMKKIRWKIRWQSQCKRHREVNVNLSQDQCQLLCNMSNGVSQRCALPWRVWINWMSFMSNGVTLSFIVWASLYVSSNQFARGLPTRQMCSILGLNVPVSKSTSLIGSSLSARIMCPNKVTFLFFHLVESLICLYPYLCDSSFKTAWLVHDLFTYVGGTPKILRSIFIWKLSMSFCSFDVNCKDSKPYRSLLARVLSKTLIFQVFEVRAWNQTGFSCLAVATTVPILCDSSWRLSTVSVKVAPKYFPGKWRPLSLRDIHEPTWYKQRLGSGSLLSKTVLCLQDPRFLMIREPKLEKRRKELVEDLK